MINERISDPCAAMTAPREFLHRHSRRKPKPPAGGTHGGKRFDYPVALVGTQGKVTVYYDPALGQPGLDMATKLLNAAASPYSDMESAFGVAGSPVDVVIAPLSGNNDGSGGAYHYGCDFAAGGVLYLDATFANGSVDPLQLEIGLFIAELSESFMGPQGGGWGCGFSNGEGLSRYLAEQETAAHTLDAFATGPSWVQAGYPDWVNQTEQTDRNDVSTGCAILYIYWMRSQGYTTAQITQAAGATLADNYQNLTGKTSAFDDLVGRRAIGERDFRQPVLGLHAGAKGPAQAGPEPIPPIDTDCTWGRASASNR